MAVKLTGMKFKFEIHFASFIFGRDFFSRLLMTPLCHASRVQRDSDRNQILKFVVQQLSSAGLSEKSGTV